MLQCCIFVELQEGRLGVEAALSYLLYQLEQRPSLNSDIYNTVRPVLHENDIVMRRLILLTASKTLVLNLNTRVVFWFARFCDCFHDFQIIVKCIKNADLSNITTVICCRVFDRLPISILRSDLSVCVCVCVCSLSYSAWKANAPYCLCPAVQNFSTLSHKWHDFQKKW
jgi:hypothetical protein